MQTKRLLLQQPFCHVRISEFRPSSAVQKPSGTVHTGGARRIQPAGTVYGQYVWRPLLLKIDKRISGWEGLALSYAGRVQIIKSVLMLVSLYWTSAFILP